MTVGTITHPPPRPTRIHPPDTATTGAIDFNLKTTCTLSYLKPPTMYHMILNGIHPRPQCSHCSRKGEAINTSLSASPAGIPTRRLQDRTRALAPFEHRTSPLAPSSPVHPTQVRKHFRKCKDAARTSSTRRVTCERQPRNTAPAAKRARPG